MKEELALSGFDKLENEVYGPKETRRVTFLCRAMQYRVSSERQTLSHDSSKLKSLEQNPFDADSRISTRT
jgi:hypothetical protein